MKVEYKVRPVTRYIVTRWFNDQQEGGCATLGEYNNHDSAYDVAYALCRAEHERLGYSPGDERIQYPRHESLESK